MTGYVKIHSKIWLKSCTWTPWNGHFETLKWDYLQRLEFDLALTDLSFYYRSKRKGYDVKHTFLKNPAKVQSNWALTGWFEVVKRDTRLYTNFENGLVRLSFLKILYLKYPRRLKNGVFRGRIYKMRTETGIPIYV